MGQDSNIEWTHHTFNPWMGCTKVSAGCTNCYAENLMDTRYGKVKWGDNGTRVIKKDWSEPRKWNKLAAAAGERHRVFCASLADVFEDRPEFVAPRARLFELIAATPHLDWLLLTKRPQNIIRLWPGTGSVPAKTIEVGGHAVLPNVWLGTSVENQATADERIPHLLRVPAAVRFLSVEPLLGAVSLNALGTGCVLEVVGQRTKPVIIDCLSGNAMNDQREWRRIDWVIVGGESGAKARPCDIAWVRSIVEQCKAANVPCFVKQLGSRPLFDPPSEKRRQLGSYLHNINDRKGGHMAEWPEDLRVRELPGKQVPA